MVQITTASISEEITDAPAQGVCKSEGRHDKEQRGKRKGDRRFWREVVKSESLIKSLEEEKGNVDALLDIISDRKSESQPAARPTATSHCEEKSSTETFTRLVSNSPTETPSNPVDAADASFQGFREDVRMHLYVNRGKANRLRNLMIVVRGFVARHELSKLENWADRVALIVEEESQRTVEATPLSGRLFADWWNINRDTAAGRFYASRPHLYWLAVWVHSHYFLFSLIAAVVVFLTYQYSWFCMGVSFFLTEYFVMNYPELVIALVVIIMVLQFYPTNDGRSSLSGDLVIVELGPMTDWCCRSVPVPPIHHTAKYTLPAVRRCTPRSYSPGQTIAAGKIWIPRNCFHNELVALTTRQLLPQYNPDGLHRDALTARRFNAWREALEIFSATEQARRICDVAAPTLSTELVAAFASRYSKGRRDALIRLFEANGHVMANPRTKAFVKVEWSMWKEEKSRNPRFISGKHDAYLVQTTPYWAWCNGVKPILQEMTSKFVWSAGMSAVKLGEIVSYYESIGWLVYGGDFSRYDARNEEEAIKAEMQFYSTTLLDERTLEHLKCQCVCDGRTASGIKYSCRGKVCSGVINTSGGNTFRNFMATGYALRSHEDDWVVVANGDDNLIFTPKPIALGVVNDAMTHLGHKYVIQQYDYDTLDYCSGYFWKVQEGVRVWGPKPFRALAKTLMPHAPVRDDDVAAYMGGVAASYKHYEFIPLLGGVMLKLAGSHKSRAVPVYKTWLYDDLSVTVDHTLIAEQFYTLYELEVSEFNEIVSRWPTQPGVSISCGKLDHGCRVDGVF